MTPSELFESLSPGQKEAVQAMVETGFSKLAAASVIGINKGAINDRIMNVKKKARKAGLPSKVGEGFYEMFDEMVRASDSQADSSQQGVFEDMEGFKLVRSSQMSRDESGNLRWQTYQREDQSDSGANLELLRANLASSIPAYEGKLNQKFKNSALKDRMTVYVLADIHFGMYAWAEESGENHDTEISKLDVLGSVDELVDAAQPTKEAMVLNLGDFFHANSREASTPQGKNQLDVDSRFTHVAREGIDLLRRVTEMVGTKHEKITMVNVRGNHDPDAAMWLNLVMQAYYRDCPRVSILDNASKMIPYSYGDTALFFYHGERMSRAHEYITGQKEARKLHGNAVRTYCLAGHIHHETVKTKSNIRFETFSTITGKDAYHADNLYCAPQNMVSIVYDKKYGEVQRTTIPIEQVR
jgi:predicted phosphodiesterase